MMEFPKLRSITKHGSDIVLNEDKFSIGRSLYNTLVIPSLEISRNHCVIERIGEEWTFLDKSSHGIFINKNKVDKTAPVLLKTGDTIDLSKSYVYIFDLPEKKLSDNSRHLQNNTDVFNEVEIAMIASEMEIDFDLNNVKNIERETKKPNDHECIKPISNENKGSDNNSDDMGIENIDPDLVEEIIMDQSEEVEEPLQNKPFQMESFGDGGSEAATSDPPANKEIDCMKENVKNATLITEEICATTSIKKISVAITEKDVNDKDDANKICKKNGGEKEEKENQSGPSISLMCSNLDFVEEELQCSICTELFIKAITLNCAHTYCKFCIDKWRLNHDICPICRNKITSQSSTLVVDNFIAKILESADEELIKRRQELIASRESLEKKSTVKLFKPTAIEAIIEVSSDDYDEDEDLSDYSGEDWEDEYNNDDWEVYTGLPGYYYGGYGSCYNCGQTGHWANGCPNRRRRN